MHRERLEVEGEAEQLAYDRLGVRIERRDLDAARRRFDPHLPPADHSVEAALVPEVREIGTECAVPPCREREIVGLRDFQLRHSNTVALRITSRNVKEVTQ